MTLTAGTRIGPYEIVAPLGAGGMGEVYRALDTKLQREVAVKVLPPALSADAERLARFEREARLLAALKHPHISVIHGIEESGDGPAIVLELVEGPTLAERLRGGPVSVSEAVAIARQVADAMEAAHDKGVIHRDLKPANITVAPDGLVKVLDFGLAKAFEPLTGDEPTEAPTVTAAGTRLGTVLGTAAYMSPEQARGEPVDTRTDIWAFGCVLYELLTGRAAFGGPTLSDTIAALLEREPDWRALPASTPAPVRRLLRRALEKDRKRRLRHIGDARIELEDTIAPGTLDPTRPGTHAVGRRGLLAAAGAMALVLAAGGVWMQDRASPTRVPDVVQFPVPLEPGQQFPIDASSPLVVAVSTDGQQIAFTARQAGADRVFLRRRDEITPVPVVGTEGAMGPLFSPDGEWIAFAAGGMLRRVPAQGGVPEIIATAPNFVGASWGPDGTIVFGPNYLAGLFKVSDRGGSPEPLTTVDRTRGETAHRTPHVLPGGRAALFAVTTADLRSYVEVVDIATGRRHRLLEGRNPTYVTTGHLVVASQRTLLVAPFDLQRLEVTGPSARVLEGVASDGQNTHFALAADGTLVYVPAERRERRLVWVDRQGASRPLTQEEAAFAHPRVSPDGSRVVVWVRQHGTSELWVYDVRRGTRSRLTTAGRVSRPIWTPDGRGITVQMGGSLHVIPADGRGEPRLLLAPDASATILFPLAWSHDGRVLAYSRPVPATGRDVWTRREGESPVAFLATARDERAAMFSPDGRWMVYAEKEPGRDEQVYVQPYPGPGERVVISPDGGLEPVWSPTGREIFYRSLDGRTVLSVDVGTEPTLTVGGARRLFEGPYPVIEGSFWSNYDVSADGRELLMLESDQSTAPQLHVVVDWIAAMVGVR